MDINIAIDAAIEFGLTPGYDFVSGVNAELFIHPNSTVSHSSNNHNKHNLCYYDSNEGRIPYP